MANFKDLTIPRITAHVIPSDPSGLRSLVNQLVKFAQSVETVLNGLIYAGQIQRTDQDQYRLGGTGVPLDVADGGTGDSTLTAHSVLIGEGTNPVAFAGPGATGTVLAGAGSSADPAFSPTPRLGSSTLGPGTLQLWDDTQLVYGTVSIDDTQFVFVSGSASTLLQVGPNIVFESSSTASTLFMGKQSQIEMQGGTSGTISVKTQAAAGTFNFNLPTTAGTAGQVLTSQGGGTAAMTWTSAAPLTVGTSTITSGTSGRVLYDNAGVLGEMTNTGTGTVNVLQNTPTLTTPVIGAATGTSLVLTEGLTTDSGNSNGKILINHVNGDANYGGIWVGGATTTPGFGNYAFLGYDDGSTTALTLFNAPTYGLINFRNNNADKLTVSATQVFTEVSTLVRVNGGDYATVGGCLFDHVADAGNTGTGEDDLYSDTLAASTLGADRDKVEAWYQGQFNGAALSTQELKVYFGGTLIYDSGALSIGVATDNWTLVVKIVRESASVVRCGVSLATDFGTLFPYSKYTRVTGLTLSNTQVLKLTGEAAGAGAADNQIVAKCGAVSWVPAA